MEKGFLKAVFVVVFCVSSLHAGLDGMFRSGADAMSVDPTEPLASSANRRNSIISGVSLAIPGFFPRAGLSEPSFINPHAGSGFPGSLHVVLEKSQYMFVTSGSEISIGRKFKPDFTRGSNVIDGDRRAINQRRIRT